MLVLDLLYRFYSSTDHLQIRLRGGRRVLVSEQQAILPRQRLVQECNIMCLALLDHLLAVVFRACVNIDSDVFSDVSRTITAFE